MSKRRIALLSNVTADLIAARLKKTADVYLPEGFDAWIPEVMNDASGFFAFEPEAVFVLLDGTEFRTCAPDAVTEKLSLWRDAVKVLAAKCASVPVFVSTVDFRFSAIRSLREDNPAYALFYEWTTFVNELSRSHENTALWDLFEQITLVGRKDFYSDKMWYFGSMPFAKAGIAAIVSDVNAMCAAVFETRKKIIATDLDGTLWGGVVGEDGADGIELSDHKEGQRFYDFQCALSRMKQRGTVLAINSKNNPADVDEVFERNPSMLLTKEDFVAEKVNWQDKASNIKELERELNLSEGSFLFVDDNPIERQVVSGECPEVTVPEFPEDTTELLSFAEGLYREYFRPFALTKEDEEKTALYRTEAKRRAVESEAPDLESYIRKLSLKADIHPVTEPELARVTQLIGKTNQFNLTTKRYTQAEVEAMLSSGDYDLYAVHTSDRFGDNGLVAVVILKKKGKDIAFDTFLMSCRVMGRKLEDVIFSELAAYYGDRAEAFCASYIPTKKNVPVAGLYDRLGFTLTAESEGEKRYRFELGGPAPRAEGYEEIRFEGA